MNEKNEKNALQIAGDVIDGTNAEPSEMWKWVGRTQAFALMANKTSAAQAECLTRLRNAGEYRRLGLTWEQFCDRELGIAKRTADRIIANYEEFGAAYFAMSSVIRISSTNYRLVAGAVKEDGFEIDGETIPITKANADRIAEAITAIRKDAEKTKEQLADTKSELDKTRKARDGAVKAVDLANDQLREERLKEANRYRAATPIEKRLIEAEEAFRRGMALVQQAQSDPAITEAELDLMDGFGRQTVQVMMRLFHNDSPSLFQADQITGTRSPIDEYMQKDLAGKSLNVVPAKGKK